MANLYDYLKSLVPHNQDAPVKKESIEELISGLADKKYLDKKKQDEFLNKFKEMSDLENDLSILSPKLAKEVSQEISNDQEYLSEMQEFIDSLPQEELDDYKKRYEDSGSTDDFMKYFIDNIIPELQEQEDQQIKDYMDSLTPEELQDFKDDYEYEGSDEDFPEFFKENIYPDIEEEEDIAESLDEPLQEPELPNQEENIDNQNQDFINENEADDIAAQDENFFPDEFENEQNFEPNIKDVPQLGKQPNINYDLLNSLLPTLQDEQQQNDFEGENTFDQEPLLAENEQLGNDDIQDTIQADPSQEYFDSLSPEDIAQYQQQYQDSGSDLDFPTYFKENIYPSLQQDGEIGIDPQAEIPGLQEQESAQQETQNNPFQLNDAQELFNNPQPQFNPQQSPELQQARQQMNNQANNQLAPAEDLFNNNNAQFKPNVSPELQRAYQNMQQGNQPQSKLSQALKPVINNKPASKQVARPGSKPVTRPGAKPVMQPQLSKKQAKQQAARQKNAQAMVNRNVAAQQGKANSVAQAEALRSGRPVPYGQQQQATWRKSTPDQPVSIKTTTPNQEDVYNKLYKRLPNAIENLNLPGSKSSFEPIANQARNNFSQNIIPGLAERFGGMGNNRLQSSGFAKALGGSIADFEGQLAAQQAQHGLQEQGLQSNNLYNALGTFTQPQFDYTIAPGQSSGVRKAAGAIGKPLLKLAGNRLTGGTF